MDVHVEIEIRSRLLSLLIALWEMAFTLPDKIEKKKTKIPLDPTVSNIRPRDVDEKLFFKLSLSYMCLKKNFSYRAYK